MSGGNRRLEDEGGVPWPALVDLLTSVLITFMFFVLITTVSMSAMTLRKAAEQAQNAPGKENQENQTPTSPTGLTSTTVPTTEELTRQTEEMARIVEENNQLKQNVQALEKEIRNLKDKEGKVGPSFARSNSIKIVENKNEVIFFFNRNEAGMLPEAQAAIAKLVHKAGTGARFLITACEPPGYSQTIARERALTRAMVIRNTLLENNIEPVRISVRFEGKKTLQGNQEWVSITKLAP